MLKALLALLLLQNIIGFHCAETDNPYLITQASGNAQISVRVPGPFIGIILDETEFEKEGDVCKSNIPGSKPIPCSLIEEGDAFTAKAKVSNVENHIFLAFIVMEGGVELPVTVYFNQGGEWTHIASQNIRPQFSSPGAIYANGKSEVDVTCATDIAMGRELGLVDNKGELICAELNKCPVKEEGPNLLVTATVKRPKGEDLTFVYCVNKSYLSVAIFWVSGGTKISYILGLLLALPLIVWH